MTRWLAFARAGSVRSVCARNARQHQHRRRVVVARMPSLSLWPLPWSRLKRRFVGVAKRPTSKPPPKNKPLPRRRRPKRLPHRKPPPRRQRGSKRSAPSKNGSALKTWRESTRRSPRRRPKSEPKVALPSARCRAASRRQKRLVRRPFRSRILPRRSVRVLDRLRRVRRVRAPLPAAVVSRRGRSPRQRPAAAVVQRVVTTDALVVEAEAVAAVGVAAVVAAAAR